MCAQEEAKLKLDEKQMAQHAHDLLAEMDEGLSQFRAKMQAKKAESAALLKQQDDEFAAMSADAVPATLPAETTVCAATSDPASNEQESAGHKFKMSKPKKAQLEGIKAGTAPA